MKETLKVAKTFMCVCGAMNKFEFETDFVLSEIKINVRCQSCGAEKELSLSDFIKVRQPTSSSIERAGNIGAGTESEGGGESESSFEEESAYADLFGRA